jgi:hypothetical protein
MCFFFVFALLVVHVMVTACTCWEWRPPHMPSCFRVSLPLYVCVYNMMLAVPFTQVILAWRGGLMRSLFCCKNADAALWAPFSAGKVCLLFLLCLLSLVRHACFCVCFVWWPALVMHMYYVYVVKTIE